MVDIRIYKLNETYLKIICDSDIFMELKPHFTFKVDGYQHMPKFKAGMWDGNISLLDSRSRTIPVGLYNDLISISTKLGYNIEIKTSTFGSPSDIFDVTIEEVKSFVIGLNIHSNGNPIEIRDYQLQYIHESIKQQRLLSLSPTASGKSAILYCLYRWYLDQECNHIMLIVPNLGLVKQMYSDFKDYSSHNGFDVSDTTQILSEGGDKLISKNLLITTWQSVYKMPEEWFKDINVIMADEAHLFSAVAVKSIFEKATNVKYRFGLSGSLDKSLSNKMVLRGLIGDVYQAKTTRELIDEGYLSDLDIKCIILKYGKETKALMKSITYDKEIEFICAHKRRNKFIAKLALSLKGNTLILFNYVEKHGELLHAEIEKIATTQKVYFLAGKVKADDREDIRQLIQASTGDSITVASVGTTSTGSNIPNLHNIIFASPSKSRVRVMQSIGRGLRKHSSKNKLKLYDIADALYVTKSKQNSTMKHFTDRLRIYNDEQHPYKIIEVDIE